MRLLLLASVSGQTTGSVLRTWLECRDGARAVAALGAGRIRRGHRSLFCCRAGAGGIGHRCCRRCALHRCVCRAKASRLSGGGAHRRGCRRICRRHAQDRPRCPRGVGRSAFSVAIKGFVETREERERTDRFILRVEEMDAPRDKSKLERVRLSVKKGMAPAVGSFVELKARLLPPMSPTRPGAYDFGRDMYFQGIGASGFVMGAIKTLEPPCAADSISAT